MTIDQILEGIEAELSLMRELGIRSIPFDRELLKEEATIAHLQPIPKPNPEPNSTRGPLAEPAERSSESTGFRAVRQTAPSANHVAPLKRLELLKRSYSFVFLHDKPLSPEGAETFEKIRTAMNLSAESAPLLFDYDPKTFPKAKLYIVMGPAALSKFMPGVRLSYFSFGKSAGGKDIHFTYSPEYFLMLNPKEKAVLLLKHKMWTALKNALQRFS